MCPDGLRGFVVDGPGVAREMVGVRVRVGVRRVADVETDGTLNRLHRREEVVPRMLGGVGAIRPH